jgi:hypothetical protein
MDFNSLMDSWEDNTGALAMEDNPFVELDVPQAHWQEEEEEDDWLLPLAACYMVEQPAPPARSSPPPRLPEEQPLPPPPPPPPPAAAEALNRRPSPRPVQPAGALGVKRVQTKAKATGKAKAQGAKSSRPPIQTMRPLSRALVALFPHSEHLLYDQDYNRHSKRDKVRAGTNAIKKGATGTNAIKKGATGTNEISKEQVRDAGRRRQQQQQQLQLLARLRRPRTARLAPLAALPCSPPPPPPPALPRRRSSCTWTCCWARARPGPSGARSGTGTWRGC